MNISHEKLEIGKFGADGQDGLLALVLFILLPYGRRFDPFLDFVYLLFPESVLFVAI